MASPRLIANLFLRLSREETEDVPEMTPLRLHSLVYLAQGWLAALEGSFVFKEMPTVKGRMLVYRTLDQHLLAYRGRALPQDFLLPCALKESMLSLEQIAYLNYIWEAYRFFSGQELATNTTKPGTPAGNALKRQLTQIQYEDVRNYFTNLRDISSTINTLYY